MVNFPTFKYTGLLVNHNAKFPPTPLVQNLPSHEHVGKNNNYVASFIVFIAMHITGFKLYSFTLNRTVSLLTTE